MSKRYLDIREYWRRQKSMRSLADKIGTKKASITFSHKHYHNQYFPHSFVLSNSNLAVMAVLLKFWTNVLHTKAFAHKNTLAD